MLQKRPLAIILLLVAAPFVCGDLLTHAAAKPVTLRGVSATGDQDVPAIGKEEIKKMTLFRDWKVKEILGKPLVEQSVVTLEVKEDGAVSGKASVNRFFGKVEIDAEKLKFGPLGMTRRAGPRPLMEQESRYVKSLANVVAYKIEKNKTLLLLDKDGKPVVRCE